MFFVSIVNDFLLMIYFIIDVPINTVIDSVSFFLICFFNKRTELQTFTDKKKKINKNLNKYKNKPVAG